MFEWRKTPKQSLREEAFRGLTSEGYHVPSDAEWMGLVGGSKVKFLHREGHLMAGGSVNGFVRPKWAVLTLEEVLSGQGTVGNNYIAYRDEVFVR